MAISYIDTSNVESIAKEIVSLASELNNEFNSLYTRFSGVPMVTREWVGQQANYYFNNIANDKKQYNDFAGKLKDIGFKLNEDIINVESSIKRNRVIEAKKES